MAGQGRIARGLASTAVLLCALLTGLVATTARAQEDHSYYGPRLIEEKVRIPAPGGYTRRLDPGNTKTENAGAMPAIFYCG